VIKLSETYGGSVVFGLIKHNFGGDISEKIIVLILYFPRPSTGYFAVLRNDIF
jgi:hypothetical protein